MELNCSTIVLHLEILIAFQPLHLYTEQNPYGPTKDNPRWHFGQC